MRQDLLAQLIFSQVTSFNLIVLDKFESVKTIDESVPARCAYDCPRDA